MFGFGKKPTPVYLDAGRFARDIGMPPLPNLPPVPSVRRTADEFVRNPIRQMERAVETIDKFGALPLKELDDKMTDLKEQVALLEIMGQEVRDTIMRVRADYMGKLEKARKVAELTTQNLEALAKQIAAIDLPVQEPIIEGQQEETKTDEQLQPAAT